MAQRVGRGVALLFHDRGTRRGYPFYRRLGGPQGRSGRAENLVPTGIWSRTVQPVVSRYTDWATRTTHVMLIMTPIPGQYLASWIKLCHSHHTTWNNYKVPIHSSDLCNSIHPAPNILLALLRFGFSWSRLIDLRNNQIQNMREKVKFFCSVTPYRLVKRLVTFYQSTL